MRKSGYVLFFAVLALIYSCDTYQGNFNESVPDLYTLTTTVSPEERGNIEPSGGEFLAGEDKQIIAQPADGYVFDHWSGDLTGNLNPNFIQFNSNKSVTAHFSPREYNLNLEVIGNGAVSETVLEQSASITVSLEAVAEEGWFFDRWEGDLTGSGNPEIITIDENEEKSVKAVFKEIPPEEYNITINTEGFGSVDRDPDKSVYTEDEEVTLTAIAAFGWRFSEWKGDLSGSSNPVTIIANRDKQITAVFERNILDEYTVNIETRGSGSVNKNPDKSVYTEGEEVTLTANAASGWTFSEWTGDLSGSKNQKTIVVDNDMQITAVFDKDSNSGLTVQEVKFYIKEMELSGARRTGDFKTQNFILKVPIDGSPFEITHVSVPRGFYDELELDIKKSEKKNETDDSDFSDGSDRYSVVVKGIYNGVDFTYQSSEDYDIEVDITPQLEIKSGRSKIIAITVDFNRWFEDSGGWILDPNDSRNAKQIDKNIEDSLSDFEDDF